ncbi:DUF5134 domain-containing protein [Mycolicibacterium mucogenicum]|uniref:DUF5134 domain-containing protein n=1 Tax=Mycolicibacterium TaxID=1866885 RepID=UPI00226AF7AC|nr:MULTISPECIES: DUF5134 domain-containing protein [Mycolicibacterium]MCX8561026.1 DUF5134 domain-containing protein [Mycolicibacterium mucogenicum]
MIADSALRWALTAVFAVAALLFVGAGRRAPGQHGVGVLHAVASVGMIAMLWPAGMRVSPLLYVLVFTAGALYFAYLALFGFELPHPVYHCTMMAAMALMGLLMAPNAGVPVATAQASGHHSAHLGHGAIAVTPPGWFTTVCVVLAAGFCAAALWWFYLLVRGPKRPYADLLMAFGMSAAFAVMAV